MAKTSQIFQQIFHLDAEFVIELWAVHSIHFFYPSGSNQKKLAEFPVRNQYRIRSNALFHVLRAICLRFRLRKIPQSFHVGAIHSPPSLPMRVMEH